VLYLLATALVRGKLTIERFPLEEIQNPKILEISDQIVLVKDPYLTAFYPEQYSTELALEMASVEFITIFRSCSSGDPESPEYTQAPGRCEDEIENKFRAILMASSYASGIEEIIAVVRALPDS
jgi:2-methylcitrate dehydratase PrpD